MRYPIIINPDEKLRQPCKPITVITDELVQLLEDMYETMLAHDGIGIAAPQIGKNIQVAVVEVEEGELFELINPEIIEAKGSDIDVEGCLSIPDVREDVYRKPIVTIEYCEEDFVMKTEVFDGLIARVIQHEYDHIEGILFTDKISSLKKRLIQKKLKNIMEGKTFQEYRMKFFAKKGR